MLGLAIPVGHRSRAVWWLYLLELCLHWREGYFSWERWIGSNTHVVLLEPPPLPRKSQMALIHKISDAIREICLKCYFCNLPLLVHLSNTTRYFEFIWIPTESFPWDRNVRSLVLSASDCVLSVNCFVCIFVIVILSEQRSCFSINQNWTNKRDFRYLQLRVPKLKTWHDVHVRNVRRKGVQAKQVDIWWRHERCSLRHQNKMAAYKTFS